MVKVLALFSGIGGMAHGQAQLGHDVTAVEKVPTFVETVRRNLPSVRVIEADVKAMEFTEPYDVVIGGPPCQPFSQAADNLGQYDARDCIPDFIRAVQGARPRLFVMEEVPTLTWTKHRDYLDRVLGDLRDLGYVVDHRVLNMADYGVPQARRRLFVIGIRADLGTEVSWPEKSPDRITMADSLGWTRQVAERRAAMAPVPGDPSWVFERPSTTVVGSFRPDVQAAPGYRKAGDGPRQNTPGSVVITEAEALTLQGLPSPGALPGPRPSAASRSATPALRPWAGC